MTLSLFAICLIFSGFCLGDEVVFGLSRNYCGELMLGSEYALVDDLDVESISNLLVELSRFRVELIFCRNVGRLHRGQMKERFGDAM